MAKRKIIFLIFSLTVFASALFLVYFLSNSAALNILYPAKHFSEKKTNLHLYNNKQISVNKTLIRTYYCLPLDGNEFGIENWEKKLNETMTEVSKFYQLQFNYNMKMDFKIYPQTIYLNKPTDYFTELIVQDLVNEIAQPHSESQSMGAILNEVKNKIKDEEKWELDSKKIDDYYVINLFVLGVDINTLQTKEAKILGLNNESNNSLVFSTGFIDDEFKNFYESVVGHEVGHALGMPKFYSYSDNSVSSSGVMGGGFTRKLKDNYLKSQIKEEMTN